jgi:hypothetical protein
LFLFDAHGLQGNNSKLMSEGGSMPGVAFLQFLAMFPSSVRYLALYISIAVLAMVLDVNQCLAAGDSTSQHIDLSLLLFD